MPDDRLEKILDEMVRQRSDLTKEQLLGLIAEKKRKIGSGFLTDAGAGYLVASELNVDLNNISFNDYSLKDLGPGMTSVNVKAYFLAACGPRGFNRRDGSAGTYRPVFLFDDNISLRLMLWDTLAKDSSFTTISIGEPLRISNVSTRVGKDNLLEIHSNVQTKIELLDSHVYGFKKLDSITLRASETNFARRGLVVGGFVASAPKPISFQRQDGSQGKALQLAISDKTTGGPTSRLVLWSYHSEYESQLKLGMEIRLINIESKLRPDGAYEFHGNEDTTIELLAFSADDQSSGHEQEPFIVVSIGPISDSGGRQRRSVLLGQDEHTFLLTTTGNSVHLFDSIDSGDQIRLKNYSIKGDELFVLSLSDADIQLLGNSKDELNRFKFKIQDLPNMRSAGLIELVVLAKPTVKDIVLKDGKTTTLSEVLIGDETGESKLIAWRNLSGVLDDLLPGARLFVYGAVPRTDSRGNHSIELRDYSSVQHIRS